jgi:hypothetical protein
VALTACGVEWLPLWVAPLVAPLGRSHMFLPCSVQYCTFSFKSTGGVTRDSFYLFDISAPAEFLCDTSKLSTFEPKILSFFALFGQFGDLCDCLEVRQRPE